MIVMGKLLLVAGLILTPVSMFLQTEYQTDVFIAGVSALGFGIGLLLAGIIAKQLGLSPDPGSSKRAKENNSQKGI